jgi:hypothetical protein
LELQSFIHSEVQSLRVPTQEDAEGGASTPRKKGVPSLPLSTLFSFPFSSHPLHCVPQESRESTTVRLACLRSRFLPFMSYEAFSTTRGSYSPSLSTSTSASLQSEEWNTTTLPPALRRAGSPIHLAEEDAEYTVRMSSLTNAARPSPNIKDILSGPKFSGGGAGRWLRQLKAQLISAGYDTVPPAVHAHCKGPSLE